eukprot:2030602-Ditylum_brightwellii.AAC.1
MCCIAEIFLRSSEETCTPYVEKKQQLPTTTIIQGIAPKNTQVTTPATTPTEATDDVPNILSKNAFSSHTGNQKSTR